MDCESFYGETIILLLMQIDHSYTKLFMTLQRSRAVFCAPVFMPEMPFFPNLLLTC